MTAAAADRPLAAGLRSAARLVALAALLLAGLSGFHLWAGARRLGLVRGANPWPRLFLGRVARIAGVRVRTSGLPVTGRRLILANHVSWIDIAALAGATGTTFVAHDGLARVPLLRWLCALNGTVFVARGDRAGVGAQIETLRGVLERRGDVTVFPEGTTSAGGAPLPFRSALLAAIVPRDAAIAVQPVWLDYGAAAGAVAWIDDEPGIANFRRILARAEPIGLVIHFLEPLAGKALADRKTMAAAAREAIATACRTARGPA